jgi:hypothetical protein
VPNCLEQSAISPPFQSRESLNQAFDTVVDPAIAELFPCPIRVSAAYNIEADEVLLANPSYSFDDALDQLGATHTDADSNYFDLITLVEPLATVEDIESQSAFTLYKKSRARPIKDYSNLGQPTRSLVDVSTLLITQWFSCVCPMWSGFDSDVNLNRVMISSTWTHSEAVMYSIKSMSAITLLDTLPHIRTELLASTRLAMGAIEQSLTDLSTNWLARVAIPWDLFMALLCMGTSLCWLNTKNLGLSYWKRARLLLDRYADLGWLLDDEERRKLAFIERSCVYWGMLCSVVTDESPALDESLLPDSIARSRTLGCPGPQPLVQAHPWTGVADEQQKILSRTLSLCRRFRVRLRTEASLTVSGFQKGLEDTKEACEIDAIIQSVDIPLLENVTDTGDHLSPQTHFIELADAYRLASLLQLHQTFPDLSFQVCSSRTLRADPNSRTLFLLKLTFDLLAVLARIPATSNTRCTQPILYIIAASGLRFEESPNSTDTQGLTQCSLKVHQGRKFILDRFASLQQTLPSKPIVVATQLVRAIWRASDQRHSDPFHVHWIDVMIETGLCTLFG